MNEWVIAGIVVVGTLFAAGAGGFVTRIFSKKSSPPKA